MDSAPHPEVSPQPVANRAVKAAQWPNISWAMLCGALVVPAEFCSFFAFLWAAHALRLPVLDYIGPVFWLNFAGMVLLGVAVARRGIRRGWNSCRALRNGWALAVVLLLALGLFLLNALAAGVRPSTIDKAVLNNARQLAAAAGQYCLEHGVTTCAFSDLVGPDKYLKALHPVARETYPAVYAKGAAIRVTGVAGVRTVTYQP